MDASERKGGTPSAVDWEEVMRTPWGSGPRGTPTPSAVDWDEVMRNEAVTAVTTMTLSNSAEPHTERTDEEILENARRHAPWLKKILSEVMADINAEKNGWKNGSDY